MMPMQLRSTLIVPPRIYKILSQEKLAIVPEIYCRDDDIILIDENGMVMTFRLLPREEVEVPG